MENLEHIKQVLNNHGYEYINAIGHGSFSNVLLCRSKKYNHLFAIKRVLKKNLADQEIKALISLIHVYIVKLYAQFADEDFHYLVMEYCPNGTLREKGRLNYEKFVFYAKQLLEVLEYCHSQKIAHRDIKPDNVFLDQYNHAKLGDFGFANQFSNHNSSNEKCGSLIYSAPEMLESIPFDPFKTDIWALGITFYYMATGEYPYPNCNISDLRQLISMGQLDFSKVKLDSKIKSLIMKMTSMNPLFRPSANKLLKLPIFTPIVPSKFSKTISSYSNQLISRNKAPILQNRRVIAPISGELQNDTDEDSTAGPNIQLTNIRTFRSCTHFSNIPKPSSLHFVKYD